MALDLEDDEDIFAAKAKKQEDQNERFVIPENAPVLPSIMSGGREAELIVNVGSEAAVLYNKPLPESIHWAEYDIDLALLTFVTYSGKVQGLGMTIHKPFRKYLSKAKQIMMIYMENAVQPKMIGPVKLVVRYTGI